MMLEYLFYLFLGLILISGLIYINYLIRNFFEQERILEKERDLLNYLLSAADDQFRFFTNLKQLALNMQAYKNDFLENPTDENRQKAFCFFNPPKLNFKINIADYAFTIKKDYMIVECIFRYIMALESALCTARAYNDEIASLLAGNISKENALTIARLHSEKTFSDIILSINMGIFILAQLIKHTLNYSKYLGKRHSLVSYYEVDNITGYIEYAEKEINTTLQSKEWKKAFIKPDIKKESFIHRLKNVLKICYKIKKCHKKDICKLVPSINGFELITMQDYQQMGRLSILATKGLHFMLPFRLNTDSTKTGFFIKSENNKAKILLGGEFEPCIFRGQNNDYEKFIPSFQRKELIENPAKHCAEYIKREEFKNYFKLTPYYQILSGMKIMDYYFEFDLDAIAQHYEFATDYLDVTKDILTALFFAYTYCIDGSYYPVDNFEKYNPTLYISNFALLARENNLTAVGFQAVSRPQRQTAMALKIDNPNSNVKADFRIISLPRSAEIAHAVYNSFKQGKTLFPEEPIQVIQKRIRKRKYLNEQLFKEYCQKFDKNESELRELLSRDYIINNSTLDIDTDLFLKMTGEIYDKLIPWIKKNIFYRTVKRGDKESDKMYISINPLPLE